MSYSIIDHKIFTDKKFKSLSVEAEIAFIFFFANSLVNLTGIYEIDTEDTFIRRKLSNKFYIAFAELIDKEMIKWDEEKDLLWVINRFKWHPSLTPKVIAGAIDELDKINHVFKEEFIKKYKQILDPYLYRLTDKSGTFNPDWFLQPENLINLSKIYNDKESMKRFLNRKGCKEQRVDEILSKVLPNLKG